MTVVQKKSKRKMMKRDFKMMRMMMIGSQMTLQLCIVSVRNPMGTGMYYITHSYTYSDAAR